MKNNRPLLLIFLFLFLFSFKISFAQPNFAPVGTKWWHHGWYQAQSPVVSSIYTYESVSDTVLAGIEATVVEVTYISKNEIRRIPESRVIFTSDEDKVYTWVQDSFYLLFDFSAEAGDTLLLGVNPAAIHYYGGCEVVVDPNLDPFFQVLVDSIFMVTENNKNLRAYSVHPAYDTSFNYHPWYFGNYNVGSRNNIIIERKGFVGGGCPLGEGGGACSLGGDAGPLICFFDPTFSNPDDSLYCDLVNSFKSIEDPDLFQISPNPNDLGTLYLEGQTDWEIEDVMVRFFDLSGKMIYFQKLDHSNTSMDISFLDAGMYFVMVEQENKKYTTEKLIVLK